MSHADLACKRRASGSCWLLKRRADGNPLPRAWSCSRLRTPNRVSAGP